MHISRFGRISSSFRWLVLAGSAAALASACGDDQPGGPGSPAGGSGGSAGSRSGAGGARETGGAGGKAGGKAGADAGGQTQSSAGAGGEAGSSESNGVVYQIPVGGGEVEVATSSGNVLHFDFPASAAGKTITLTPDSSASVGWDDGRFQDVIRMAPDGLVFNDPVVVRPQSKDVLLFDYATTGAKGQAEGLPLNAEGDGVKLSHFSTLVVVPASVSCLSTSGWQVSANSAACSAYGSNSTRIDFGCKAPQYCLYIAASCCAPAGSTECQLGMSALQLTYTPSGTNNGAYPYCASATGTGGSGGGGTGGAATGGGGTGGAATGGGGTGGTATGGTGNGGTGQAGAGTGGTATGGAATGGTGVAGTGGTAGGSGGSGGSGGVASTDVPTQTVAAGVSEIQQMVLDGSFVFYIGGPGLARVPVTGGTPLPLGSSATGNFDVDATYAYWSDGSTVQRRLKDASAAATTLAFTGPAFVPTDVWEDSGTLFMASNYSKVFKAPAIGGAAVQLVTGEPQPHSLVVLGADLYYATYVGSVGNQSAVVKVATAGGTPVVLISGVAGGVQSIAIAGGFIYYSSSTAIARIPIAGGAAQPLATAGGSTLGVEGSDVFFINNAATGVSKAPITGGTVTPLITTADGARGIGVSATYVYFSSMNGSVPGRGMFRFAR